MALWRHANKKKTRIYKYDEEIFNDYVYCNGGNTRIYSL